MNTILISIIAIPIIEIMILLKSGKYWTNKYDFTNFFTAVVGVYFARIQGIKTLKNGLINMYQNKLPFYEILSGASIAIAALFLILPGFFTDSIGFLLLIPLTRKLILYPIMRKSEVKTKSDNTIDAEIIEDKKDEL